MQLTVPHERVDRWLSTGTLTKKASLNAVASVADYAARLAVELAVTPLLVAGLGDYLYGAWRVLYRFMGYLWASGGRSSQELKMFIAGSQSSGDLEEKRRYVGSAVVVWLLFLPFSIGLGCLAVWLGPSLLHAPAEHYGAIRIALGILMGNAILVNIADIPKATLGGENLGYKRMGLSALIVLAGGVFVAAAVHWKMGIQGVALAAAAGGLLNCLLFFWVARRQVPWFGMSMPTRGLLRRFTGKSVGFLVWKWVNQFLIAGDVLFLGVFGSVELVTVYSLSKFGPDAVVRLCGLIVHGAAPGIGGILGSGKTKKVIRARAELMTLTWLAATVSGCTILLWNPSFLGLWVGEQYDVGLNATLLIVVMSAQLMFIRNDSSLIDVTLDIRRKVQLGVLATAVSAALCAYVLAFADGGILGMCWALIAGRAMLTVFFPRIVGRRLSLPAGDQFRSAVRPAMASTALLAAAYSLSGLVGAATWLELAAGSGLTVAAAAPPALYLGLNRSQRLRIVQRFRELL